MNAVSNDIGRPYPGRETTYLHLHRGIAKPVRASRLAPMLLVGAIISAAWILALPWAGDGWVAIIDLLRDPMGISLRTHSVHYALGGRTVMVLPEPVVEAGGPGAFHLAVSILVCLGLVAVSAAIRRERAPLIYFLRTLAVIHGASVLYHTLPGRVLPYAVADYVSGLMGAGATIIALVPLVLAATHFLFDFGIGKKVGLALAIMGYLYVLIPVKYVVHAIILDAGGMLYLPILFILFGLPVEIFAFVALFGWGMSWADRSERSSRASV